MRADAPAAPVAVALPGRPATSAAAAGSKARILEPGTTGSGKSNGPVAGPNAPAETAAACRRRRRRRRWALLAILFPLFFLAVIALGVAAMYYHRMEFFRPPPVGGRSAGDRALVQMRVLAPMPRPAVGTLGALRARCGSRT